MMRKVLVLVTVLSLSAMAVADVAPYPYHYVSVRVADGCQGMGTVSGGNRSFFAGNQTTIRAAANKGNAFEGWYLHGTRVSREANYTFRLSDSGSTEVYEARFVAAKNDSLRVEAKNKEFGIGESLLDGALEEFFSIDSGSAYTIRISGLPTGVKYDATSRTFHGAPTRRNVYYVTCAVQNGNGFKQTGIAVWNVGNADNGDYDQIGLDWDSRISGDWRTGGDAYLDMFLDEDKFSTVSVRGLPSGIKKSVAHPECACEGFLYGGKPTRAGKYVLKVTARDSRRRLYSAAKTVIVDDGGSGYLDVAVSGGGGTATGSGVYPLGAKVRLSARPASGYYFAGWYEDAACKTPFSELADWRKPSDSFVFSESMESRDLYARFVTKAEDSIAIDGADAWDVNDDYRYDYEVASATLPTETVKGLPTGIAWDKVGRCFTVADTMKLKPGTTVATITAKNKSGLTATKEVRIVVPNLQSWVFEGLDYSDEAYHLVVGVGDFCVPGWLRFQYDLDYKVTVSGLPPGLRLEMRDGTASVRGSPTRTGTYTVTLVARKGNYAEKATFTINVDPLPDEAVGTFNGTLRDEEGATLGSFVFTAAANGKQSVKVVTAQGTMSLSASAWNCYDEASGLTAYFFKRTKNEEFAFMLTPMSEVEWNCEEQLTGTFSWSKSSTRSAFDISGTVSTAQRNPFSKTKGAYDHPVAAKVAESLAADYRSKQMAILWDEDLGAYCLEAVECMACGYNNGTATLKMNKNGTATVSGKLYGSYSFSATTPLVFDTACREAGSLLHGEYCYALFTPIVKEKFCSASCAPVPSGSNCVTENVLEPIYWFPLD